MRSWNVILFVAACAGPSQQQVVETSAARAPATHAEAPAASTSDKEREQLVQSFDDMDTTQRAYREANQDAGKKQPPRPNTLPAGHVPPPKKTGPAEQAPLPPEQASRTSAPASPTP